MRLYNCHPNNSKASSSVSCFKQESKKSVRASLKFFLADSKVLPQEERSRTGLYTMNVSPSLKKVTGSLAWIISLRGLILGSLRYLRSQHLSSQLVLTSIPYFDKLY